MKTAIKKVSQEEMALNRELDKYGEELGDIKFTKDTKIQMIRMVRAASSEEKAVEYIDTYRSMISFASRSVFFSFSQKIEAIRATREFMDHLGISYPDPPESIKGLFEGDDKG